MGKALGTLGALFGLFGLGAVVCGIVAWSGHQLDRASDKKGVRVIRSGTVTSAFAEQPALLGTAAAPVTDSAPKVLIIKNGKLVQPGSTDRKPRVIVKKVPCTSSQSDPNNKC
jgi:hypothetical protein